MIHDRSSKIDNEDDFEERKQSAKFDKQWKENGYRRLCYMQLFSVIIFALGVVGGILIGIYGYHGGLNSSEIKSNC